MQPGSRILTIALTWALLGAAVAFGKLPFLPADYYVRHADTILLGTVATRPRQARNGSAEVVVEEVLFGGARGTVLVHSADGPNWEEDEAVFEDHERVLLFIKAGRCVQGMAGKVNIRDGKVSSYFFPSYPEGHFRDLIRKLIFVRCEPQREKQIASLLKLLDTNDTFVIDAAASYLSLLVDGIENPGWTLKPSQFGSWSYRDYYDRNAKLAKKRWLEWAKKRPTSPPSP